MVRRYGILSQSPLVTPQWSVRFRLFPKLSLPPCTSYTACLCLIWEFRDLFLICSRRWRNITPVPLLKYHHRVWHFPSKRNGIEHCKACFWAETCCRGGDVSSTMLDQIFLVQREVTRNKQGWVRVRLWWWEREEETKSPLCKYIREQCPLPYINVMTFKSSQASPLSSCFSNHTLLLLDRNTSGPKST